MLDSEFFLSKIGSNLMKIRTEQRMSQSQLAFESGLTREFINKLENGKVNVSVVNIVKIANVLDVHPKELFDF